MHVRRAPLRNKRRADFENRYRRRFVSGNRDAGHSSILTFPSREAATRAPKRRSVPQWRHGAYTAKLPENKKPRHTRAAGACCEKVVLPFRQAHFEPMGSSAGCDEALQLAQGLQPQFHRTEALRLLELGSRAEHHAHRHLRRTVLILERGPGVGMFRPVLAP